ncbi:serine/threonine protein kinase [Enterocloster asparagiformis]|uniref:serine/threonine protein kinase n=1 Tax=Enterocloster asparagiformis TaxID=333367 RepID=UPI002A8217EC|nr:serine/threonine protein kinase [Enterocloster asparagiformis]
MKRSRLWLLFPILSVFMIIFAFWLSRREGSYKQTTELSFEPVQDMFTIELQAEEKYMEPHVSDGDAELMWESATGSGKSYLRIKGKLPEHRLGKPVALRIESDSGNKIREMEILSVSGISAAGCQIDVVKDDTWPLYVGFSLALIAAMAFLLAGSFGVKKKRKKFAYALELAEGLRNDPSAGDCFEEGQRYFLAVERMCIVDTLSGMLFVWISVLWVYRRSYSPGWSRAISWFLLAMAAFFIITYFLRIYRNRIMLRPLLYENRPLSASTACLLSGINGIGNMKERAISLHNAAVGLYRSGRVREALTLEDLAWKLAGKHKGALLCFLHSDLRSACLRCLREEQAAEREELKLEIMLEETPWLCKNRDIQMRSLSAKIRGLISGGDLEQAEIEGNYYLDRCHNDYHRLPMLAMIAEVKEMLEKPLEAADLRKRLLRYSPENHEVLKAMTYGPCIYSYTRLKAHDFTGIILRAAYVLAVMFFLFQLTDGAAHSKGQEASPVYIETEMSSSAGIDNKETTPSALKETASEEPVDSIVRKAAEFSITYPENWDGLLFSIRVFNNGDYVNEPDYEILGYDGASVYFQTVAIPL